LSVVKDVCSIKQQFTQFGGARPFGVSVLFAGVDNGSPSLYSTEPTGIFFEYKATAIGEGENEIKQVLEKDYRESLTIEEGIKLAIKSLKKALGKEFDLNRVDGAYIKTSEKRFKRLTTQEIKKSM